MAAKTRGVIIISTFSDSRSARDLGRKVLDLKLCACVNFVKIESMYSWKGRREEHPEYLALFKTTKSVVNRLKTAICRLHPYEVPEIVELDVRSMNAPYLSWLTFETSSSPLADRVAQNRHNPAKR